MTRERIITQKIYRIGIKQEVTRINVGSFSCRTGVCCGVA
jgi:hypothetical protein